MPERQTDARAFPHGQLPDVKAPYQEYWNTQVKDEVGSHVLSVICPKSWKQGNSSTGRQFSERFILGFGLREEHKMPYAPTPAQATLRGSSTPGRLATKWKWCPTRASSQQHLPDSLQSMAEKLFGECLPRLALPPKLPRSPHPRRKPLNESVAFKELHLPETGYTKY